MGGFLSGALGTNSQVNTTGASPVSELQPYQQTAQNQLIPQLQTEAAGGGPNPAQQQYLQNSQQISQNQANTYAQNRSLNPGLAARMAGNTAAGQQQQAASTAGIQQAQQQLGAQQLEGNVLSQQQTALNQAGAVNAQIAGGNQQAASGLVGGLMNGIGGAASMMAKGGMVQGYDAGGSVPPNPMLYGLSPSISGGAIPSGEGSWDSGIANNLSKGVQSMIPGTSDEDTEDTSGGGSTGGEGTSGMSGLDSLTSGPMGAMGGAGASPAAFAKGGTVSPHLQKMADIYHGGVKMGGGGMMGGLMQMLPMLAMAASKGGKIPGPMAEPKINQVPQKDRFNMNSGKVPAVLSRGEEYLSPEKAKKVATGKENPMSGEIIPGKAKVKGDSEKNDVVPKTLEVGGIVVPRSAMGSEEDAQKFVAKEMAKHKKSPEGEFREALKRAVSGRKNK